MCVDRMLHILWNKSPVSMSEMHGKVHFFLPLEQFEYFALEGEVEFSLLLTAM